MVRRGKSREDPDPEAWAVLFKQEHSSASFASSGKANVRHYYKKN